MSRENWKVRWTEAELGSATLAVPSRCAAPRRLESRTPSFFFLFTLPLSPPQRKPAALHPLFCARTPNPGHLKGQPISVLCQASSAFRFPRLLGGPNLRFPRRCFPGWTTCEDTPLRVRYSTQRPSDDDYDERLHSYNKSSTATHAFISPLLRACVCASSLPAR